MHEECDDFQFLELHQLVAIEVFDAFYSERTYVSDADNIFDAPIEVV